MRATTFKSVFFLVLSAALAPVGTADAAEDPPDGQGAIVTDSCPPMPGSPPPCPVLDYISDVGEITLMTMSNSMDFQDFGVQYWGESFRRPTLESAPHGALIIEPSLVGADASLLRLEEMFLPSEIMAIRKGGTRPVFGYLNVGELASYRDYWVEAFGSARRLVDLSSDSGTIRATGGSGPTRPTWYGAYNRQYELLSAFWTKEWEVILQRRIDALLAIGFDGVFLDDVLHYFSWGDEGALARTASARGGPATIGESARAMMALIIRLSRYARSEAPNARPSFKLIVNGAPYIAWDAIDVARPADSVELDLHQGYFNAIDAILVENALNRLNDSGLITMLRNEYAQRGMPVLTIEFWSLKSADVDFETFRAIMLDRAKENGFRTYAVADGLFDRLYPPASQRVPAKGSPQGDLRLPP